jgi:hypothetical protein
MEEIGHDLLEALFRRFVRRDRKPIKIFLHQDNRCVDRDSNPEPADYESEHYRYGNWLGITVIKIAV